MRMNKRNERTQDNVFIIRRTAAAKMALYRMQQEDIIALDMEFIMIEERPCLIQIASSTGDIHIFDVVVCEDIMSLDLLKTLMERESPKKVNTMEELFLEG